MRQALATGLILFAGAAAAQDAPCGGDFGAFKQGLVSEAGAHNLSAQTAERFLAGVSRSDAVLAADRRQGIFQSPFIEFSRKLISADRIERGRAKAVEYAGVFDRIEAEYGVPRWVLLAFWAFETDYGSFQGDFNTADALVTLAHDCRRPELFRPQVFAAMELFARGDFDPATTTGAWAGEIGMVQMLPEDIIENGIDGDGDGHVSLKTSAPDALMSGGKMLSSLGWQANQPWLEEVTLPGDFDWSLTGLETERTASDWAALGVSPRDGAFEAEDLPASVLLPQGKGGPAFLAYPNFRVFFEWNQSFTYVLTAAYFATRLDGAEIYRAGKPAPGLSDAQMKELQQKLAARGHDVGEIDGILGAGTRAAVRAVQAELGLPVDAWPTPELLGRL
ncbi:lytic murein transglycosylase [Litorisediminicola beolgyonensis]|uniref:Lytic murein transglycosylase n=1 Tax=Litorisediminicola beolgyonensis TaxID=1173614 RepID=A0ABW3ZD89_9RHOB